METYISMLRGINVGPNNRIAMAALKALFEKLKYEDVRTYIQSGNVIFKTTEDLTHLELASQIERAIKGKFKLQIPVVLRTLKEMKKVVSRNPFLREKGIELDKLHVSFLSENPKRNMVENLSGIEYPPDRFIISGQQAYLHCPKTYSDTQFSNQFFEQRLKLKVTTRNWKTVNQLILQAES